MKRFISLLLCIFTLSQLHAAASDKKPVNDRKMYMLVSPEGYALKNTLDGEVAPHILVPADRKDKSLQHAFHEDEGGWIIWCPANGKAFDTDGSKTGGIRLGSWGMEFFNPNQIFTVNPVGNGRFTIVHKETGCNDVAWYGRGPQENYIDRMRSADLGIWNSSVDAMSEEHYVRSQSRGNREDVRWATVADVNGNGVRISADGHMAFSALYYTDEAIASVTHDFELPSVRSDATMLYIDAIQQGLGNATCGPTPLQKYMIPENSQVRLKFRIERTAAR